MAQSELAVTYHNERKEEAMNPTVIQVEKFVEANSLPRSIGQGLVPRAGVLFGI